MGTRITIHTEDPVSDEQLEAMDEALEVPHSTTVIADKSRGISTMQRRFDGVTLSEEDQAALLAVLGGEFTITSEELQILYHASFFPEALRALLEQAVGPDTAKQWRGAGSEHPIAR